MQKRRRGESRTLLPNPNGVKRWKDEELPIQYWDELASMDPEDVCTRSGASHDKQNEAYTLPLLYSPYVVHPHRRQITCADEGSTADYRFSETTFVESLILVVYLLKAQAVGLAHRRITEKELPGGETFFRGPHELSREPVLARFKRTPDAFLKAGTALGGETISFGDAALSLRALPRIPLEYILWTEDEEFPARLTITFDASAGTHLPLDVLWALVYFVSDRLARTAHPV